MSQKQQTQASAALGEPAQAGGARAAEGGPGLDLSLGHVGTHQEWRRWMAVCDACNYAMGDDTYTAAEAAAGPDDDPKCPRCARRAWIFFPES